MTASDPADLLLVQRLRRGEAGAWEECIALFEGRLMAYVNSRLNDRTAAEDVVQETFLGFLTSLPNYDDRTPLESFLFAIAAHKLIDLLRHRGRRPILQLPEGAPAEDHARPGSSEGSDYSAGSGGSGLIHHRRRVSSLAASRENRQRQETALSAILSAMIERWRLQEDLERLQCIELLFVAGWPNKQVAAALQISEQTVANHKSYVVGQVREKLKELSSSEPLPRDLQAE